MIRAPGNEARNRNPIPGTPPCPGTPAGERPASASPFLVLEEEAHRVARSMARLRTRSLNALNGPGHTPLPSRPPGDTPRPGPRTPLGFSPFYYLPFLFADAFPGLGRETLRTLCLSNRILLEAILIQDRQIDESRPWSPEDLFLVASYHHRAMELLLPLLHPDHPFWGFAERCFLRAGRSVLREQFRRRYRLSPYGKGEFAALAAGKVALIRTTPHAMAALSGVRRFLAPLLRSQTLFLVGFQAFDDLRDWKEDLENRNFTHLLSRILEENGFREQVLHGRLPPEAEVAEILHGRGYADEQLRAAEGFFRRALLLTRDVPVPLWREVVRGFAGSCQDMRDDFAEIRRRGSSLAAHHPGPTRPEVSTGPQAGRPPAPGRQDAPPPPDASVLHAVRAALSFVIGRQERAGGFRALRASSAYLHEARPLAPSRCVTRLIQRGLGPLRALHPPLARLLERSAAWLGEPSEGFCRDEEALPDFFERAFSPLAPTGAPGPGELPCGPPPDPHDRFPGLFWTELLHEAARSGARARSLEALAEQSIRTADYDPWTRGRAAAPAAASASEQHAACRPLLPLFLLLQAPGPDLFRPRLLRRLREDLSARLRTSGGWGNPTDTALHVLCLLCAGAPAKTCASGTQRLLMLQEPDGSWAPNAFCKAGDRYYGSRELTTAWCGLALFLAALLPGPGHGPHPPRDPRDEPRSPRILLHRGLPEPLLAPARRTLRRLASLIRMPDRTVLTLGTWACMPAHFLVPGEGRLLVGVNLPPGARPPFRSQAGRPVRVETVLAMVTAARVRLRGPLRDRLERVYVLGLALHACGLLWPHTPAHRLAGLSAREARWCREHEPYLWSAVRAFLTHPCPRGGPFRWLLPFAASGRQDPIPAGAALYLGTELFRPPGEQRAPDPAALPELLGVRRDEILRAFRIRTGVEPRQPGPGRRSFRETRHA